MTALNRKYETSAWIDSMTISGSGLAVDPDRAPGVAVAPVVHWDPSAVEAGGRSPVVPVVVMDTAADSVSSPSVGRMVAVGDPVF